ncbi:hypothetical protein LCM10_03485 [Rossellomorea aquimaris]|uniref:hypothetical protein n=1 Tax=Rossellomorea aquimaris TaxID=189382 RepID=UPI001CD1AC21|nr:hypothetical protein [Rossellomorea aquimaris]MCA1054039.1 hypothetical protein [Rossellomorea aquimaris]
MLKTLSGKLSAIILLVFIVEAMAFVIAAFSNNGFGALVNFMQYAPYTSIPGVIFGLLGMKKEEGIGRIISIMTFIISILFIILLFVLIFGYTFGG